MKNNKSLIKTYKTFYEVDIVIANRFTTLAQLQKRYTYLSGDELTENILDAEATTTTCKDKKTNRSVILIKHNRSCSYKDVDKKYDMINLCAHEAVHAILDIYWIIGEQVSRDMQEPTAYFIGWLTEEIHKTFTQKS